MVKQNATARIKEPLYSNFVYREENHKNDDGIALLPPRNAHARVHEYIMHFSFGEMTGCIQEKGWVFDTF